MATIKDKTVTKPGPLEDNKAFVLNWLQDTPRLNNKNDTAGDISTRLEDILDELQGDSGHTTMKIRLR